MNTFCRFRSQPAQPHPIFVGRGPSAVLAFPAQRPPVRPAWLRSPRIQSEDSELLWLAEAWAQQPDESQQQSAAA